MNRKIELTLSFFFIALLAAAFVQNAFAVTTYKISNVFLKVKVDVKHPDGSTTELTKDVSATYPFYSFFTGDLQKPIESIRFTWLLYDNNPEFQITSVGAPEIRTARNYVILGSQARDNWQNVGDRAITTSQDGEYTVYRLYTVNYTMDKLLAGTTPEGQTGTLKITSLYVYPLGDSVGTLRGESKTVRFENDKLIFGIYDDGTGYTAPTVEPEPNDPQAIGDDEPDSGPIICTNDCNDVEAAGLPLVAAVGIIGLFSAFAYTKIVKPRR